MEKYVIKKCPNINGLEVKTKEGICAISIFCGKIGENCKYKKKEKSEDKKGGENGKATKEEG